MRLNNINTIEEANAFLPQFLNKINMKFGKAASNPEDAHRSLKKECNLKKLFARKETRKLSKDLTFQYKGVLYMLQTKTPNRMKHAIVDVLSTQGEPIEIYYNGNKLAYKKWSETVYEKPKILDSKEIAIINSWLNKKQIKPRKYHPWR
jgi:hypothetical protein